MNGGSVVPRKELGFLSLRVGCDFLCPLTGLRWEKKRDKEREERGCSNQNKERDSESTKDFDKYPTQHKPPI